MASMCPRTEASVYYRCFGMEFRDKSPMRADIAGRPIYLGLAMTADNIVRLKPQNLLINLPLAKNA